MPSDRITQLFAELDPAIKAVVMDTLTLEQQHISMERPRIKEQLDEIVTRVATKELARADDEKTSEDLSA